MMENSEPILKNSERVDDLELGGLRIIQNKNWFSFGVDAVLLSDMVHGDTSGEILDLASGNGIIPILLYKKTKASKIIGIEIQSEVCDMATRSLILNGIQDRVSMVNEDLRLLGSEYNNRFTTITINPPYFKTGTGITSDNSVKMISRHEIMCTLEDVFKIARRCLVNKGSLLMVHRANRIVDIFETARKYKLEPKRVRFVSPKPTEAPNLVLIKFTKGAKRELIIEKPLHVYKEDGAYSDEILDIYSKNNIDSSEKR